MLAKTYETMFALGARLESSFGKAFSNAQKQMNATSKQVDRLNRSFGTIKSGFGRMAAVIGGAVGVGSVGGLFTKAIGEASNLEQYRNTLEVVLKDTNKAAEAMKWASKFANITPFETSEVVDATVKLSAYGMEAQKVLPAVGDMAGVMGKTLDQAVEAVADAQTGELERLKEFGIRKQDIIDHGNKIMRGKEIVNQKGQITDYKAFNKALFSLMEERFKGGMDRQARTFKGTMSTITGVFGSSLAQIAGISEDGTIKIGSLFDTVRTKALELGNKMQQMQEDGTFAKWGESAAKAVNGISEAIVFAKDVCIIASPALAALTTAYLTHKGVVMATTLAQYAQNAATVISNGLLALQCARIEYQTVVAATGSRTIGIITAAQWLWNAAMSANPIGAVIIGIAALSAGIIVLIKNWDKVTAAVKRAWEWLAKWKKGGGDKVQGMGNLRQLEVGKNAIGTNYWRGGLTWVGEKGPELVSLPRGSQIKSNQKSLSELKASMARVGSTSLPAYSPQIIIQGNADEKVVTRALDLSYEKYNQFVRRYEAEKRRLQFSPS